MTGHAAIVAPSELGAVEVTGDDRASYLHQVLTQSVEGLRPGGAASALYLDAQGRPLAVMEVAVLPDRIVLVTPTRALAEELAGTLGARTFLADARFEVLEASALSARGPGTRDRLGIGAREVRADGTVIVLGREDGADVLGPADELARITSELTSAGAEEVGTPELETWRVAAGRPAWGREIRAPHLPEELGLLATHTHLEKGCYPGQEAVARMWMLGRPRRRLARVRVRGDADAGWSWGSGRQQVELTSVADVDDGDRVGLAFVPPDASPGDRYGEPTAEVEVRDLVGADRPVPGHDPSVARRRDRTTAG